MTNNINNSQPQPSCPLPIKCDYSREFDVTTISINGKSYPHYYEVFRGVLNLDTGIFVKENNKEGTRITNMGDRNA